MATLTVTASQSGAGAVNGMALTVKVLTGALPASAQNGATVQNNTTITAAQLPITPHASGSVVYGAAANGSSSSNFTPLASTTMFANVSDAVNGAGYGTLRGTSVTTASTPVTIGASAPTGGAGTMAISLAEILAATVIAEDASSPVSVSTTAAKTVTTASFSPPAASLLVAMVSNDFNGTPSNVISISDSSGLLWQPLVQDSYTVTSVWIAQTPGSVSSASIVQTVSGGTVNDYGIGTTTITTAKGNSIVVFAGWQGTSFAANVQLPAISVSDSAGNLWKQIDISSPSGSTTWTRGAVWIAVNARSVGWVSVSVTGASLAAGWLIAEIRGLPQNVALDFALAQNAVASSASITGTGSAQGVGFAMVSGAGSALTVSAGPSGWTALTRVPQGSSGYGISVMPYWNPSVPYGSNTLNFTLSTSDNFNVLYCQILYSTSPPAQYSTQFPLTVVEAAFGANPGLVSSSAEFTYSSEGVLWQDISSRVIGGPAEGRMTASRGKQYELSQAEAGTLEMMLDNHDGAFTPTYPGSPYYSNAINQNMAFANGVTAPWTGALGTIGSSTLFAFASGLNAVALWSMTFTPNGVNSGPGFTSEFVPVNPNYTYSYSFWIYSAAGWASGINAAIVFYNSAKTVLGTTSGTTSAIPAATWTQFTVTGAVPPAGTFYAVAEGIFSGTPTAVPFYICEAALVTGSSAVRTGLVALLTPVRVTTWWDGVQYAIWQGFVERWPQTWPEMPQWGFSKVTAIDAVGVMASISMSSALVSDVLIDNPYAYLPCNEQYTVATVGSTSAFPVLFGNSPYYTPADANGLIALNKATGNQVTGTYSDGQAFQQVSTGVAMNFFGDNSTGAGSTGYQAVLFGHRGPCMIYADPALSALSNVSTGFTIEFWFTWTGGPNGTAASSITLLTAYGPASSFWWKTPAPPLANGAFLSVDIVSTGTSNALNVTVNQSLITGPAVIPSSSPQHVVLLFNPAGISVVAYLNGALAGSVGVNITPLNMQAITLGPGTYSYSCNNSDLYSAAFNYAGGHLAVYPYQLTPGRIASHYQTGATGYSGVSAAFRFAQVASWTLAGMKRGGYYTLGATGVAEATQIGPAYALSGASAAEGINQVAQSEGGQFFVAADGTATYIERQFFYNTDNSALFGDNATSDTVPLNLNPAFITGTTGWTASSGSVTTSAVSYGGNGSGLFTPSGSGGTATLYTSTFPATALTAYDAGAWIQSPGGYGSMQTVMTWLNSSGGTISTAASSVFAAPGGSWVFAFLEALGPAGVATGKFGIREISSPRASDTFYTAYGSVIQHSTEVPFLKETEFGFDNTFVYNEVTSTQEDGPSQSISADYRDTVSQGQYFRRSALGFQQNVVSPYDIADITTWSATQYKQPSVHLSTMTVNVSSNPLVGFPVVLHLDIGDIVTVTRRPVGGGEITIQGVIERIQTEIGARSWQVTYQISPYAPQNSILCADTNGFNVPATTTLGW